MSPHRVSSGGSFRLDRRFRGVGRIALASGTNNRKQFERLDGLLTELHQDGRHDILRAIRDRNVTPLEVLDAQRSNRLHEIAGGAALFRPIREEVERWLSRATCRESSRKRYRVSFDAFFLRAPLGVDARVRDLERLNWEELASSWPTSGADWNRLRAAVSAFLTFCFDRDKAHPFRRKVMPQIPRKWEDPGRVPDLTRESFHRLLEAASEHVRPAFEFLALTGLRVGEYLRLEDHHLHPITRTLEVPGTKTEGSRARLQLSEEGWRLAKLAVPAPLRYKALRSQFNAAVQRAGLSNLTLHDLRHFHGQLLANAGVPEALIQQSLRHSSPAMTRRYTRQADRGQVAEAMDRALLKPRWEA